MKRFLHHTADLFDYDNHATMESQFVKGAKCQVDDNKAVVDARKALVRDQNSDNYVALGDALCRQLRYREAVYCYDKALLIDNMHRLATRRRAIRYLTLLRTVEARQAFLQCEQLGFDKLDCIYRLALCSYYEGRFDECQRLMTECLDYCKTDKEMHVAVVYWLALSLLRQGKAYSLALEAWDGSSDVGHHVGYLYFLQHLRDGKKAPHDMHPLTRSIYEYGKYCLMLYHGEYSQANAYLQRYLVQNKEFWGGFAYLGALSDARGNFAQTGEYPTLQDFFAKYNKIALAFSGGVDSAYLLYMAVKCGAEVYPYFVKSQFQPQFELDDANKVAEFCGVPLNVLSVDALTDTVVDNPSDRCYHCKKSIMTAIALEAHRNGCLCIVEGTNATDDVNDRAGYKALKEMGIFSPLRICSIGKGEIREFARKVGLPNADKVSYACLATRIAIGDKITQAKLDLISKAEEKLKKEFDLKVFRVRLKGICAVLESCASEIEYVTANFQAIKDTLTEYFQCVELSDKLHGEE